MILFTPQSRKQLRDYQERVVADTIASMTSGKRPILVLPTGGGKTVTATAIVERLGLPTLWLAHRKELVDQAANQLRENGLEVGVIMAGYPRTAASVQVASVQTLVRRDKPDAGLIVIDECHHAASDGIRSIIEAYPTSFVLGLTATPFRLDGRGLDTFSDIIAGTTTADLVDRGTLHSPRVWSSKSPDLRGVRVIAGDYNISQLAERQNTDEMNSDIVANWQRHAAGKRTVCFAVNVEHSQEIVSAFVAAGVPSEHLDGTTPRDQRDAILARLASGETLIVSNCMVLTEGWDLPALEACIIARPTASLNLHLQMIGRVMRSCEGKAGAIVLDHAGNHHVHGLVTRRLRYSLDGSVKVGHDDPLGLRRCSVCGLLYDNTLSACPECGHAPTMSEKTRPEITGLGQLSEFDDTSFEYRKMIWNTIEAEREAMDYKPGWSVYRFEERFGVKPYDLLKGFGDREQNQPVVVDGEMIDVDHAGQELKRHVFSRLSEAGNAKGYKPGWASWRFKLAFGSWPRGFVAEVRGDRATIASRWAELNHR